MLDEPLSNLDANLRLRLRDDLRRIIKRTGVTALYVTHDQAEAAVLGDRVGVMRDGRLLQMAAPNEIYNRPADLFVANFTGASNELAGTLLARNGEFGTIDLGQGQRAEAALLQPIAPGDAVRIALRPENIALGKRDGANTYEARVLDCRYQGTQTIYDIDVLGRRLEAKKAEMGAPTAADKTHLSTEDLNRLAREQDIPGRSSMKRANILRNSSGLGAFAIGVFRCSHCSAGTKRRQPGNSAARFTSCHFG